MVRKKRSIYEIYMSKPQNHRAASLAKENIGVPKWSLHASCGTVALICRCQNFAIDLRADRKQAPLDVALLGSDLCAEELM